MAMIDPSRTKPSSRQAPQWCTWPQNPCDILEAKRWLTEYQLKGMVGSVSKLASKQVTLAGLGATGAVASSVLAQSGVGAIDMVDPDSYGDASFLTQPALYRHRGQPKALVQGARAQQINPACFIRAARCYAQDLLLRDLRKADLIVVAGDNALLPLWAGRVAVGLGIPMIQASVFGETCSAIVRSHDLRDVANPCPRCSMSKRELSDLTSRYGCDIDTNRSAGQEATRTMPAICVAAGALAANEAIKWFSEADDIAMCGEELTFSLLSHQSYRTQLPRNPDCNLPHSRWHLEDVPTGASETTLRCLAQRVCIDPFQATTQVRSEIPWISFTICGSCGRTVSVRRFARPGGTVGRCACAEMLTTVPQGIRSVIPPNDLKACSDKPIAALGLQFGEAIGILRRDQWVYFFASSCDVLPNAKEPRS